MARYPTLLSDKLHTFFSKSSFDFNSNLNGRIYSDWLWLYFLATVVLTVLVAVGTWLTWKTKKEKSSKATEASLDDDSTTDSETSTEV